MTIYEMTKSLGKGKGEDMMWTTTRLISDAVEESMDKEPLHHLKRAIYGKLSGGHYNEEYAMEDVASMYYKDSRGMKHYAPYWAVPKVMEIYSEVKSEIPDYNCWDFFVTMNMLWSDEHNKLKKWFPSETDEELSKRTVESSIDWLKDEDNPYGTSKIWCYLNP